MVATAERALPATNISAPTPSIAWSPLRLPPSAQHGILLVRADEVRRWSCPRETSPGLLIEPDAHLIPALSAPTQAWSGQQAVQRFAAAGPSSPRHRPTPQSPERYRPAHCRSTLSQHPSYVPQPAPPGRRLRT